jgi:iron complex outermembrane recepter protein
MFERLTIRTLLIVAILPAAAMAEGLTDKTTNVRGTEEPVQWTPVPVTVITADEIDATYRQTLEDLQGIAPGLIVDSINGTPRGGMLSLRGAGNNGASHDIEPHVAVMVDGIYVGTHASQLQGLFDFETVEIARGPQGTLSGAPNLGGTVHLKRKKPKGELDLDLRASFGNFDRREFDIALDFPILDSLSGKLTYSAKDSSGDMRNVTNGRDENDQDRQTTSASLLWQASDRFTLHYIFDKESDDSSTPALLNLSTSDDLLCMTTPASCAVGGTTPQTISEEYTAQNFSNDRTYSGDYHTLNMGFEVLGFSLTSVTGHRKTSETSFQDMDATQIDFYSRLRMQQYDQFSQEITARKQHSDALTYSFGIYHLSYDYSVDQEEYFILHALDESRLACCFLAGDVLLLDSEQQTTLQSAFAHATYKLDDRWTFDAGVRFSVTDKDYEHHPRGYRIANGFELPSRISYVGDSTWKRSAPTLGVSYNVVDSPAMIFLRYSTGFVPGIFDENATTLETAQPTSAPTAESWELGMNSDWLDQRLRLNMSYFQVDYDDVIKQFALPTTTSVDMKRDNVAQVEVNGFELEIEILPYRDLLIRGAYSHTNADFEDYIVPDLANPGEFTDLSILQTHYTPPDSLFLSFEYSTNLFSDTRYQGNFSAYAGYRYYADYQTNATLNVAKVKNWSSWDLSVEYGWHDWTLRLFSQNFNNKRYTQNVRALTTGEFVAMDAATTIPVTLATVSEINQPQYTGLEIIFRPDLTQFLKR